MNQETKPTRDGVWTCNGLSADFRLISDAAAPGVSYVETAAGFNYAPESELQFDTPKKDKQL